MACASGLRLVAHDMPHPCNCCMLSLCYTYQTITEELPQMTPKKQIVYHHMLYENKSQNQLAKGTPFPVAGRAISPGGE